MAGLEVMLRNNLPLFTGNNLTYLSVPIEILRENAEEEGGFSKNNVVGEGPYFKFKPFSKFSKKPWVKIDNYGYRNAVSHEDGTDVDIVILGDSVGIAVDAQHDLGDNFRDRGYSAINLSISGHGPLHYYESLVHLINKRKIHPKIIVVSICMTNDWMDAKTYADDVRNGSNYIDRVAASQRPFPRLFGGDIPRFTRSFYSIRFIYNLFYNFRFKKRNLDKKTQKTHYDSNKLVFFNLPYPYDTTTETSIDFPYYIAPDEEAVNVAQDFRRETKLSHVYPFVIKKKFWKFFYLGINGLIEEAQKINADVILVPAPTGGILYLPYIRDNVSLKKATKFFFDRTIYNLTRYFDRPGVYVADITTSLVSAVGNKKITVEVPDYHLSTEGVKIMAKSLLPRIDKILLNKRKKLDQNKD
ncbi:MAG: hypothetical protein VX923_00575 [Pseudomonadota bacterium]|nr:hypothetical protein [Pseudomonadota bacterium]